MAGAQPRSTTTGGGVISELALARAQRNTVMIIDDLFSSRLLLAEIVRQIDGKLNEPFYTSTTPVSNFQP